MPKAKKQPRSKEQILAHMKRQKDMRFVKDKFYPQLIKASKSVSDATQNLSIMNTVLMEAFLGKMKEFKFKEFNLTSKLSDKDPKYSEAKKLLELLDDMNVFDAKGVLEGVKNEIETFKQDEFENRTLDTLKTRWLDEIAPDNFR